MARKGTSHNLKGGWLEYGTLVLDPASIAAAAQGTVTGTITGAKTGDLIFMNPEGLDNRLAFAGAKITSTDTVTVYLNSEYDASTAVDGASLTWDYLLIHLT